MLVHKKLRQKGKNVVELLEYRYYVTLLLCVTKLDTGYLNPISRFCKRCCSYVVSIWAPPERYVVAAMSCQFGYRQSVTLLQLCRVNLGTARALRCCSYVVSIWAPPERYIVAAMSCQFGHRQSVTLLQLCRVNLGTARALHCCSYARYLGNADACVVFHVPTE